LKSALLITQPVRAYVRKNEFAEINSYYETLQKFSSKMAINNAGKSDEIIYKNKRKISKV
jgi:hypothetical protein